MRPADLAVFYSHNINILINYDRQQYIYTVFVEKKKKRKKKRSERNKCNKQ